MNTLNANSTDNLIQFVKHHKLTVNWLAGCKL